MDYKELAFAIKLCGSTPKVDQCKECSYWAGGDMSKCIQRMTADAATAITDLLARAEAAEARLEMAHEELEAVRKAQMENQARAEKAEREVKQYKQFLQNWHEHEEG